MCYQRSYLFVFTIVYNVNGIYLYFAHEKRLFFLQTTNTANFRQYEDTKSCAYLANGI